MKHPIRYKFLFISILFSAIFLNPSTQAQDAKFGGPFTALSYNKHGYSLSVGGGGSFITIDNFFIGIYGQVTTDAFERTGEQGFEDFLLKSRQTGFWFGFIHKFKNTPRLSTSLYQKVGFGQVLLNKASHSLNYYDRTIVLTPNLELSYQLTSFFEMGISIYYEIYTCVDLFHYRNSDFNSIGFSVLFKIKKS